jgi:hypothetical protein
MKQPFRLPILLVGLVAFVIIYAFIQRPAPQPAAPPPPLISLEKMGHLVSLKMNYADIIEFTQPNAVDIPWTRREVPLGSTRVLLVARGDCTVATDLRQARYENIDNAARTLTVVLPQPAPLQARLNHEAREKGGSYFYAVTEQGLQTIIPDARTRTGAMDKALATAQASVQAACSQPALLATARANAAGVLHATLLATGWTPDVTWEPARR